MVEQAAERLLAQDGPNAFSFCAEVLGFGEPVDRECGVVSFFGPARVVCSATIGLGFDFSRDWGRFLGSSVSDMLRRLFGSGVGGCSMACVGVMRPRIGKSVRYADAGAPWACGAHAALLYRSADRWVDAVRLVAAPLWAAAVHRG